MKLIFTFNLYFLVLCKMSDLCMYMSHEVTDTSIFGWLIILFTSGPYSLGG